VKKICKSGDHKYISADGPVPPSLGDLVHLDVVDGEIMAAEKLSQATV